MIMNYSILINIVLIIVYFALISRDMWLLKSVFVKNFYLLEYFIKIIFGFNLKNIMIKF
jgi:hypothetical protein